MVPTIKVATSSGMMASDIYSEEYARRKIYITGEIMSVHRFPHLHHRAKKILH